MTATVLQSVTTRRFSLADVLQFVRQHKADARANGTDELTDFCCRQMADAYPHGDDDVRFWHVEAELAAQGQ